VSVREMRKDILGDEIPEEGERRLIVEECDGSWIGDVRGTF
jgi:hypothetical protein